MFTGTPQIKVWQLYNVIFGTPTISGSYNVMLKQFLSILPPALGEISTKCFGSWVWQIFQLDGNMTIYNNKHTIKRIKLMCMWIHYGVT